MSKDNQDKTPQTQRTFTIVIRDDIDAIYNMIESISSVERWTGSQKKFEVLAYIFRTGLSECVRQMGKTDNQMAELYTIMAAMAERRQIANKFETLAQLESLMMPEEFLAWCEEKGVNLEAFIEWRDGGKKDEWSTVADKWLQEKFNAAEGKCLSTKKVKQLALAEEVIDEKGWDKLKVLASRRGYSAGHDRGVWGLPKVEDTPF